MEGQKGKEGERKQFTYSVDGTQYHTDSSVLTGAEIKAKIANLNPTYVLVLEGHDKTSDRIINDADSVDLDVSPPCRFYLMPPATFG